VRHKRYLPFIISAAGEIFQYVNISHRQHHICCTSWRSDNGSGGIGGGPLHDATFNAVWRRSENETGANIGL